MHGKCLRNVPSSRKEGDIYLLAWHVLCLVIGSTGWPRIRKYPFCTSRTPRQCVSPEGAILFDVAPCTHEWCAALYTTSRASAWSSTQERSPWGSGTGGCPLGKSDLTLESPSSYNVKEGFPSS